MALIVRDPIHGSIELSDWAIPLVDAPVMQRLRRVQQLGTAHLVYPGANHKRFEHSLGAHHLAGRLAQALGLAEEDGRTVRAAALLHDVGHGPFSHAFEELLRTTGRRHEETSVDLVRWGPLADLLRQGGLDPVAVSDAIVGKGPLAGLVSGAIDADRMDYLVRDAHYTGVRSGADPDRIIGVVARHDDKVVLREAGVIAAEALLSTRFLMYPAVYLHHTVRSSEVMLLAGIEALVEGGTTLAQMERDTDDQLLARMRAGGGVAQEMVGRLDERRLYKRAFEGRAPAPGHVARLEDDAKARAAARQEIADDAGVPLHHVLIDVPRPPRFRELDIEVLRRVGDVVPLAQVSRLVEVLQEARLDHWRYWVFAPKRDRERVGKAAAAWAGLPPSSTGPA